MATPEARTEAPNGDPDGSVAIIFGGGGGVGSALATRLADSDWRVVVAGRTQESLDRVAATTRAETRIVDATDADAVEALLQETRQRHGRLDGVANCVGSLLLKPAHQTSVDEFDDVIRTNLGSAFAVVRAAARTMTTADAGGRSGGSVVLVSTAAALGGFANHEAIAAAKAGVVGLMQAAAATYAPRNLRINAVAPGLTNTPLAARLVENPTSRKASEAMHALGRIGEPDHVASMIAWLLDPGNDWTTGQVIAIDGGLSTLRGRPRA